MRKFTFTFNVHCPTPIPTLSCFHPVSLSYRLNSCMFTSSAMAVEQLSPVMSFSLYVLTMSVRLSNNQPTSRCSLLYTDPFRMIEELKGILSRYTILMSFNHPDYNQHHTLKPTLDINTSFTHQS